MNDQEVGKQVGCEELTFEVIQTFLELFEYETVH